MCGWTLKRLLEALAPLGRCRVISSVGASTFEAICELGPFVERGGHLNAITDAYHWHLRVDGCRFVTSHDEIHERSGRQVLYFSLREKEGADPFLSIYLYRPVREDFTPEQLAGFAELHGVFQNGVELELP